MRDFSEPRTAFGLPGKLIISVWPRIPATGRLDIKYQQKSALMLHVVLL